MSLLIPLEDDVLDIDILPLKLSDLEPRFCYTEAGEFLGTRVRLPATHTIGNRVFYHQSLGKPADLLNLLISLSGDLTAYIDRFIIRTRKSPAISSIAMGGDTMLRNDEVGITINLARDLIQKLITEFNRRAEESITDKEKEDWNDKSNTLAERLKDKGPGILSGLEGVYFQRHPSNIYAAICPKKLVVCSVPGYCIYVTRNTMLKAGGDFDGDPVFVFLPEDDSYLKMYDHCMRSSRSLRFKEEWFDTGTNLVTKKGKRSSINLKDVQWSPENELTGLIEAKEKSLIGVVWYALMHYAYLTAHYANGDVDTVMNDRFQAIQQNSGSEDLVSRINFFVSKIPNKFQFKYSELDFEQKKIWFHLCYVAMFQSFFPIYEIIFDLRKGDGRPPFNPEEVISSLMGFGGTVDWNGLKEGEVWTDLLKTVWSNLEKDEQGFVDLDQCLSKYPAMASLVKNRRGLSAASRFSATRELIPYMEKEDFCQWLINQLNYGGDDE